MTDARDTLFSESPYFYVSMIHDQARLLREYADAASAAMQSTGSIEPATLRPLVLGMIRDSVLMLGRLGWAAENVAAGTFSEHVRERIEDLWWLGILRLAMERAIEDPEAPAFDGVGSAAAFCVDRAQDLAGRFLEWAERHEPEYEPKVAEEAVHA